MRRAQSRTLLEGLWSVQPPFTFFIATFFVVWRCDSFFVSNWWKTLLPITKQELKPLMPYTLAWLRLWSINFGYTKLGWFLPALVHICKVLRPRFEVICFKKQIFSKFIHCVRSLSPCSTTLLTLALYNVHVCSLYKPHLLKNIPLSWNIKSRW